MQLPVHRGPSAVVLELLISLCSSLVSLVKPQSSLYFFKNNNIIIQSAIYSVIL